MSIANRLRDDLEVALGKKKWDKNPLIDIGLSPSILRLGLNEDELYDHCRKIARDLFMRFHEDRNEPTEAQARFSSAFNLLKDREVFSQALSEFKTEMSEFTSEMTHLHRVLSDYRSHLESKQHEIDRAHKEYWMIGHRLEKMTRQHSNALRAPAVKALSRDYPHYLARTSDKVEYLLLEFEIGTTGVVKVPPPDWVANKKIVGEKVEDFSEMLKNKNRVLTQLSGVKKKAAINSLRIEFRQQGLAHRRTKLLFKEALESKELFPTIVWEEDMALRQLGFDTLVGPSKTPKFTSGTVPGQYLNEKTMKRYKSGFQYLSRTFGDVVPWVCQMSVRPRVVEARESSYSLSSRRSKQHLIGSLEPSSFKQIVYGCDGELTEIPETELFEVLEPTIQRGNVLVTLPELESRLSTRSDRAGQRKAYETKQEKNRRGVAFRLGHIVIDMMPLKK